MNGFDVLAIICPLFCGNSLAFTCAAYGRTWLQDRSAGRPRPFGVGVQVFAVVVEWGSCRIERADDDASGACFANAGRAAQPIDAAKTTAGRRSRD